MIWAHTLSNKPGLQKRPQQSKSETIAVASKETMHSTLLMRARVTVLFYRGRHEKFIAVCLKILVGQESKCQKNLEEEKKENPLK